MDINAALQQDTLKYQESSFKRLALEVASGNNNVTEAINQYSQDICNHVTTELETLKFEAINKDHHSRVVNGLYFAEIDAR